MSIVGPLTKTPTNLEELTASGWIDGASIKFVYDDEENGIFAMIDDGRIFCSYGVKLLISTGIHVIHGPLLVYLTIVAMLVGVGLYRLDLVENYGGMPLAPAAYNPYWNRGMPMGMDGFMTPFGGGMPYMGYAAGPLDVPFAGMLPQEPFATQL